MKRFLIAMLALAASAFGADVTGTWTGPATVKEGNETRNDTALLVLKQEGSAITGTIGPAGQQGHAISKGTVEGDNIRLECVVEGENKLVLRLKRDGDKMTGELKAEGPSAPPISGTLTVERKK